MNENLTVGTRVRVSLSDAPEFTAEIIERVDNGKFGIDYKIKRANGREMWISSYRIVSE